MPLAVSSAQGLSGVHPDMPPSMSSANSANGVSWKNPWKLKVIAYDYKGRRAWQRYILNPNDWTHISLRLPTRNFNRCRVTKIVIKMTSTKTRTFWLDGLIAR